MKTKSAHLLLALIALLLTTTTYAAKQAPITGQVVNDEGEGIEYATVVLLQEGRQVTGNATNEQGEFSLKVPEGEYTLTIQYLGYESLSQPVRISEGADLGRFTLKASSTQIEQVEVKAQLIRREADRFVVDVANSPMAVGKNGVDILEHTPGVWVQEDKISINGKSGSKVYINDRELKLDTEQLLAYLRSLQASDIQRIEVIPTTGADYDASSSGGVIKITLKKQRENGVNGSVSMGVTLSERDQIYMPQGSINAHIGKVDINASLWGSWDQNAMTNIEQTHYTTTQTDLNSRSELYAESRWGGGNLGVVWEVASRHSIGASLAGMLSRSNEKTVAMSDFNHPEGVTHTESLFDPLTHYNHYSTTFNYIYKLDTLGSTLKFLADYVGRDSDSRHDNQSHVITPTAQRDSLYRDHTRSLFDIATATLAMEKVLTPRWRISAGAKYTYNRMDNDALYEFYKEGVWQTNESQSFKMLYEEHISALYATVSGRFNRWSVVAGLRGEYTYTSGREVQQRYFSLFPNANISYALNKEGSYSLIAQYARKISRPSFWALTPNRMQLSDYTYQVGNPNLDPGFTHDVSLTAVLKHKYTLTLGAMIRTGEIQQTLLTDPEDPNILCLTHVNFDTTTSYYLAASLPIQCTKWWQVNINLFGMRQGQRLEPSSPIIYTNMGVANTAMTFSLPAKFYLDVSYSYQSKGRQGSIEVDAMHRLNAGIKKRFGERFILSFMARNLIESPQVLRCHEADFERTNTLYQGWNTRRYEIKASWNFKAGKAFKQKQVESASQENRL